MRVGIDVSVLAMPAVAGRRHYLRSLLPELLEYDDIEWVLLHACRADRLKSQLPASTATARAEAVQLPWFARLFHRGLWAAPVPAPPLPAFLELDVFHVGEFYFPRGLAGAAGVATVHDLTTVLLPDCHPPQGRLRDRKELGWIRRHARRCIAVSAATAADLEQWGRIERDRIDVVHEAAALSAQPEAATVVRSGLGLSGDPFVLSVGTLEPRKNLVRLIKAFESLPPELSEWRLVLAGRRGWRDEPIFAAAAASPASPRIHLTGAVSAERLAGLYAAAEAFAYPSLYEGFGLPVLEAMAAGTPVLTSNRSSLPEVAGPAALLVDPENVQAIRDGLLRLLSDAALRQGLSASGRKRASQFSWKAAAFGTREAYLRAAARPPVPRPV